MTLLVEVPVAETFVPFVNDCRVLKEEATGTSRLVILVAETMLVQMLDSGV